MLTLFTTLPSQKVNLMVLTSDSRNFIAGQRMNAIQMLRLAHFSNDNSNLHASISFYGN